MKTTPYPNLPRPPDIMRAQCPEANPINYLSDYLWKFNRTLNTYFPWIYYDMQYGRPFFDDDRTTDCGEMKFDSSDLTMNICGTEYTHSIGVYTQTFRRETISPEFIRRKGEGVDCAASWTDYIGSPTYTAETYFFTTFNIIQLRQLSLGGEQARSLKYYLKFDTSAADPDPTSATLRIYIDQFSKSAGLDDPNLQVYSQDWGEEVDTGDRTGGSVVASQVIGESDEDTFIELDVGTDSVTIGGDSKYRLTFEEIEDETVIGCEEIINIHVSQLSAGGKMERLILGYGG